LSSVIGRKKAPQEDAQEEAQEDVEADPLAAATAGQVAEDTLRRVLAGSPFYPITGYPTSTWPSVKP
jgi:hypothetical protein